MMRKPDNMAIGFCFAVTVLFSTQLIAQQDKKAQDDLDNAVKATEGWQDRNGKPINPETNDRLRGNVQPFDTPMPTVVEYPDPSIPPVPGTPTGNAPRRGVIIPEPPPELPRFVHPQTKTKIWEGGMISNGDGLDERIIGRIGSDGCVYCYEARTRDGVPYAYRYPNLGITVFADGRAKSDDGREGGVMTENNAISWNMTPGQPPPPNTLLKRSPFSSVDFMGGKTYHRNGYVTDIRTGETVRVNDAVGRLPVDNSALSGFTRISGWFKDAIRRITDLFARSRENQASAERACALAVQGQGADNPFRAKNIEAEKMARRARQLEITNQSDLDRIRRDIERMAQNFDIVMEKMKNARGYHTGGIIQCQQEATLHRRNQPPIELKETDLVQPGDIITTKPGTYPPVQLALNNGSRIGIYSGTIRVPFGDTPLEQIKGRLWYWKQSVKEATQEYSKRFEVITRSVAVAVRGTKFDLEVDDHGFTHLILYDGTTQLSARPENIQYAGIARWWTKGNTVQIGLPAGNVGLLKVRKVFGQATIKNRSGSQWRMISPGDTLLPGDSVKTGSSSLIHVEMYKGRIGAIGENSIFQAVWDDNTGMPLYGLWCGKLYLVNPSVKDTLGTERPTLLTPNNIIGLRPAEFEILVDERKLTHVTLYKGSIEVEADASRLPEEENNRLLIGDYE